MSVYKTLSIDIIVSVNLLRMLAIDCRAISIICLALGQMTTSRLRRAFGKKIRELRKSKGYSQESLAEAVGLHRTYIGSIERGDQNVSIDNIGKIAVALRISLSDLFRGI